MVHPYAIVITCSDSRVPAELIFDSSIGDIFVIRTAGNVVSDFEIGSVEYGAEHLGSPLVFVLGHTNCGAVTAATEGGEAEGKIQAIVDEIEPSVQKAKDVGAKTAWLKIQEIDESACINRLMALEGAIRGIKKTILDEEVKADLKEKEKKSSINKSIK